MPVGHRREDTLDEVAAPELGALRLARRAHAATLAGEGQEHDAAARLALDLGAEILTRRDIQIDAACALALAEQRDQLFDRRVLGKINQQWRSAPAATTCSPSKIWKTPAIGRSVAAVAMTG